MSWKEIEGTVQEIIDQQNQKLLTQGRRIIPTLTPEDLLQPNDYPELENHPEFRYEEGILAGMLSIRTALRVLKNTVL